MTSTLFPGHVNSQYLCQFQTGEICKLKGQGIRDKEEMDVELIF
jgi:hypothetical protein